MSSGVLEGTDLAWREELCWGITHGACIAPDVSGELRVKDRAHIVLEATV